MAQVIYDSAIDSPPTTMYSSPPPSPPSSHPTTSSNIIMGRSSYQLFLSTQSRVIRIFNLSKDASSHLSTLFYPNTPHVPLTIWSLRREYGGNPPGEEDSVWVVFKCHEQALSALSLAGATVSVATALESDLEPFHKLRKLEQPSSRVMRLSHSISDLRSSGPAQISYTLSTNPPNPRNTFRQGDWICTSISCAAHNFMRNLICIGCGNPRPASTSSSSSPFTRLSGPSSVGGTPLPLWPRLPSSPRFAGLPSSDKSQDYLYSTPNDYARTLTPAAPPYSSSPPRSLSKMSSLPSIRHAPSPSHSFPSTHPSSTASSPFLSLSMLTPSGRSLASTGRVQNINPDANGTPCIMFWPDNEPLPDISQIRPPGSGAGPGGQVPPILNTGNKGPIEQQPGDWVCGVCDYLNWRRRKVCQTCYPYAEGNSDGVSPTIQAERIAVLAQVLAATQSQARAQAQVDARLAQTCLPHSIPTPPNDSLDHMSHRDHYLYRTPSVPESGYAHQSSPPPYTASSSDSEHFPTSLSSHAESRFTHLPSFLRDEDDYAALPSPATPPLSTSSGASSPQSTQGPLLHGHHHHHPVSPTSSFKHVSPETCELPLPKHSHHQPSSPSSLVFPGGSSIWTLRKEEVDR